MPKIDWTQLLATVGKAVLYAVLAYFGATQAMPKSVTIHDAGGNPVFTAKTK